jgi:hypothetical protein
MAAPAHRPTRRSRQLFGETTPEVVVWPKSWRIEVELDDMYRSSSMGFVKRRAITPPSRSEVFGAVECGGDGDPLRRPCVRGE